MCSSAEGATYTTIGECWCNNGMTDISPDPVFSTCWFEAESTSTVLWSAGGLTLQGSPAPLSTCAFVAGAVGGAAVALLAVARLRWLHEEGAVAQALVEDVGSE